MLKDTLHLISQDLQEGEEKVGKQMMCHRQKELPCSWQVTKRNPDGLIGLSDSLYTAYRFNTV